MRTRQLRIPLLIALLMFVGCQVREMAETSDPTPAAADKAADEAREILEKIQQAYRNVQTLEVAGEISGAFEAAGRRQHLAQKVSGRYQAPNRFRHETANEVLLGSTGEQVYMYNPVANAYFQTKLASPEKPLSQAMHGPMVELLQTQDPALFFAVVDAPVAQLLSNVESARRVEDVSREGTRLLALELKMSGGEKITFLVDPESYLLQEMQMDWGTTANSPKIGDASTADLTVRYTSVVPGAKFPANYFQWTPPPGAQDMGDEQAHREGDSSSTIVGQSAPDFTLTALDGNQVSLKELQGRIVVLDFWASWCPPCVESLPRLARLAREHQNTPLAIYAVNVKEERPVVQAFTHRLKVKMPVLLDGDGEVAKAYQINSLPQTVLVGADGSVKRVFLGAGAKAHVELRREIETLIEKSNWQNKESQPEAAAPVSVKPGE